MGERTGEKGEVLGFEWGGVQEDTETEYWEIQSLLEALLMLGQTDRETWSGNQGSSSLSARDR